MKGWWPRLGADRKGHFAGGSLSNAQQHHSCHQFQPLPVSWFKAILGEILGEILREILGENCSVYPA